jgi:transcriptional regulator with XRE-family HTH domain
MIRSEAVSLQSTDDFVSKLLNNKKSRAAYVYEHIRNGIPFQLRAMRDKRDWSQADLAERTKKSRTTITRLENPNNEGLTIKTLLELASAFDVALLIKFVPFSRLLKEYEDVSSEALNAKSITDKEEIEVLKKWTAEKTEKEAAAAKAPAYPLRVIEGKGNKTPQQIWLEFMHQVEAPIGESEPKDEFQEPEARSEQEQQNQWLAVAAGGQRYASTRG